MIRAASRSPLLFSLVLVVFGFGARVEAAAAGDVQVLYWVEKQRASTFVANVLIRNLTDAPITPWRMTFDLDHEILELRHVAWTTSGSAVTVDGVGWTRIIQPGGAVWFTYEGVYRDTVAPPTNCRFNGTACVFAAPQDNTDGGGDGGDGGSDGGGGDGGDDTGTPPSVDVRFRFTSVWDNGYVANVAIVNRGRDVIEGWTLGFRMGASVGTLWNGRRAFKNGRVEVSDAGWNRKIAPGDSAYFGFQGGYGGTLSAPSDCTINGYACAFEGVTPKVTGVDGLPATGALLDADIYPNPLVEAARIRLRVGRTQALRVDLYDLLGRRVARLFDGTAVAGQTYEIPIGAGSRPPGTYFVRFEGARRATTRSVLSVR